MIWRTKRSAAAIWLLFDMNMGGLPAPVEGLKPYYEDDVTILPLWKNEHVVKDHNFRLIELTW